MLFHLVLICVWCNELFLRCDAFAENQIVLSPANVTFI